MRFYKKCRMSKLSKTWHRLSGTELHWWIWRINRIWSPVCEGYCSSDTRDIVTSTSFVPRCIASIRSTPRLYRRNRASWAENMAVLQQSLYTYSSYATAATNNKRLRFWARVVFQVTWHRWLTDQLPRYWLCSSGQLINAWNCVWARCHV